MDALIKKTVAREPESVGQLLKLYGYDASPTERNFRNLITVYGARPLPFSNATGTGKPKTFAEILGMVKDGVQTIGSIVSIIKTGKLPTTIQSQSTTYGTEANDNGNDQKTPATKRVFGLDRNIFIVLALLVVLVFLVILFRKK